MLLRQELSEKCEKNPAQESKHIFWRTMTVTRAQQKRKLLRNNKSKSKLRKTKKYREYEQKYWKERRKIRKQYEKGYQEKITSLQKKSEHLKKN